MNFEVKLKKAYSYDLDDTLIQREGFTRGIGFITGKIKSHRLPSYDITSLPTISREIVDLPLSSLAERISFSVHSQRNLIPGIANIIAGNAENGIDIYGNTGRSNKKVWVEMTQETLRRGAIDHFFQGVFYTPDGVKTAVSKAAALQDLVSQYKEVSHFEDDPRTAAYLALLFPNVDIYLIHYGTTGLLYSREEINKLPNIHRIGSLREHK